MRFSNRVEYFAMVVCYGKCMLTRLLSRADAEMFAREWRSAVPYHPVYVIVVRFKKDWAAVMQ